MPQIPFFMHDLGQPELDSLARVLAGPILTTGETVKQFEERFASLFGVRHAVGVTSCTAALQLSLTALGIGPGDEVITTPLTFIASATAIIQAGATPVFADVEARTALLDVEAVAAAITPRTRAILPVHLYGQMCDMPELKRLADRHGLAIVEDAAHCLEGSRDGVRPGQLGDAACFSFYATKSITSGEGGALVTKSPEINRKTRLLRHHGMDKTAADRALEGYRHWDMLEMGWKYNMDNLQAALLLPQLERFQANWLRRLEIAAEYDDLLGAAPDLSRPATLANVEHARHLYPVWVDKHRRDAVIAELNQRGIATVVNYRAIHLLQFFREKFGFQPGMFPNAEWIGDRTLSLPLYPALSMDSVAYIASQLQALVRRRAA
jgi:UDP-4-amino-4-deoxy-L-arabinose-oxoglutarate aminotransferase